MMPTLGEAMTRIGRHFGRRPAMRDDESESTWTEFSERVTVTAGLLHGLGVKSGERVAIYARNSIRFDELKWGAFHAGIVAVPVNWRLAPVEIAHILADSGCELIFVEADFISVFDTAELAPWRDKLICLIGEAATELATYDHLFETAHSIDLGDVSPDDDALILYTGGTTGRSKGVRLSHTNIISCAAAFTLATRAQPDDTYLHLAPMFHSADLLGTGWMLLGAAHAYVPMFSPTAFLDAVSKYEVTATVAVPTMLMMTLTDPALESADTSSLRLMGFGASPMDPAWIKRTAAGFPHTKLFNCYGLTETAPDLTVFDPTEFEHAVKKDLPTLASVGKPNCLVDLKVVDADGNDLPPGETGVLLARGPNITKGYLNLPEETATALGNGWLRTGDVARIDDEGYVYLIDREKDLIISGGENVYSSEVETALYQHPDIHECAVIGTPDERLGQIVTAVIVAAPDVSPTSDAIIDHCRKLIGGYKIPRRIEFVEAMPKNELGKILKTRLRDAYAG